MRTILVLNAKGGSGKSTLATTLASYYAVRGQRVALADMDVQRSSLDWLALRDTDRPEIKAIDAVHQGLRIPPGVDVMIIDAPAGTHGDALSALVQRAQTILIPVVPSPVDMRAAERFMAELTTIKGIERHKAKVATIANRAREGTQATTALEAQLEHLKLPDGRKLPFLARLRSSVNYLRAAERGGSIFEFAPTATEPDRECWAPILRWLSSARSLPS